MVDETKVEAGPLSADDVIKVENARAKNKLKRTALFIGGGLAAIGIGGTVVNQVIGNTQGDGGAVGATLTQFFELFKFVFAIS